MKHSKLFLAIAMLLVGLLIPVSIRFGVSLILAGMILASMIYEQEFWFGDGKTTKEVRTDEEKATENTASNRW